MEKPIDGNMRVYILDIPPDYKGTVRFHVRLAAVRFKFVEKTRHELAIPLFMMMRIPIVSWTAMNYPGQTILNEQAHHILHLASDASYITHRTSYSINNIQHLSYTKFSASVSPIHAPSDRYKAVWYRKGREGGRRQVQGEKAAILGLDPVYSRRDTVAEFRPVLWREMDGNFFDLLLLPWWFQLKTDRPEKLNSLRIRTELIFVDGKDGWWSKFDLTIGFLAVHPFFSLFSRGILWSCNGCYGFWATGLRPEEKNGN